MNAPTYRSTHVGGCVEAVFERDADGVLRIRSTEPLGDYPVRLSDRLAHWAREAPQRCFAAMREQGGDWRRISYAQMLQRARSVGAGLLQMGASVERPVMILSGNDLEHLTLAMGAMWAGVPYAPISPAYSLMSSDHAKLRHIAGLLTPQVFYAADPSYAAALRAVAGPDATVVLGSGAIEGMATTAFDAWLDAEPTPALDAAHEATGADTIVKFLFTSGSTRMPKGVVNTHRMMCSNQQMLRQCMAFLADEPPVLVDWLPWNHTFGGNHNVGITLYNGGTLYIDEGKPTPNGIAETLRNLREISPTVYFNVPKGFEEIVQALEHDEALSASLFRRVQAFMFAGAGLSQKVWDRLDELAERACGERIPMITGLGMTETAPSCTFAVREVRSGHIGLPCPGVEVKLVPSGDKQEVRFRGPNVMPGYWRAPDMTAEAFDEEGYYCTGDAAAFIDPDRPQRGLRFDGRIAEDFKLSTGTFVSVGPLRARVIAEGHPCVQDAVITGLNRDEVGLLLFPRLDDCRRLAGAAPEVPAAQVLAHPSVRAFFQDLVTRLYRAGTGSANRIARARVLVDPPSIDRGEVTDKGSINLRAVLTHRAALVDAMYDTPDDDVIRPLT